MKQIRIVHDVDTRGLLEIYTPIVTQTFISFELEPPTIEQFRQRIADHAGILPWLVIEEQGELLGYAYSDKHRSRWGYQWSAEVSAYIAPEHQGRRLGKALYTSLLNILRLQGYYNAYAGIALPNPTSVAFHEALGFRSVAHYPKVGFKMDGWRDVGWWFLELKAHGDSPPKDPVSLTQLVGSNALESALTSGLELL